MAVVAAAADIVVVVVVVNNYYRSTSEGLNPFGDQSSTPRRGMDVVAREVTDSFSATEVVPLVPCTCLLLAAM